MNILNRRSLARSKMLGSFANEQIEQRISVILLLAFIVTFWVLAVSYRVSPMVDDAAINFRYAESILNGNGVAYNSGDAPIYGASSMVYLLSLALLGSLGLDLEWAAININLGSLAAASLLLYSIFSKPGSFGWASEGGRKLVGALACGYALLNPSVLLWSTQGMETGFHIFLCIFTIFLYDRNRHGACGILLGLSLVNKLDSASLALTLGFVHVLIHRRIPWRIIVSSAAVFGAWCLFAWAYFGSPIPMSLQAKLMREFAQGSEFVLLKQYLVLPTAIALLTSLLYRTSSALILSLWLLLYVTIYSLTTRGGSFPWYRIPSDFVRTFLLAIVVFSVLRKGFGWLRVAEMLRVPLKTPSGSQPEPGIRGTLGALALTLVVGGTLAAEAFGGWRKQRAAAHRWAESIEQDRVDIGNWLRKNTKPGESLISAYGWPSYLSKLRVYDSSGLNWPELVALMRKMPVDQATYEMILSTRPHYLINHQKELGGEMKDQYILVASWTRTPAIGFRKWHLWARKDSHVAQQLDPSSLPLVFPNKKREPDEAPFEHL